MTATEPVITLDMRERLVKSYAAFQTDRPLPRNGRLCEAPAIVVTGGAGCVASTPRDMGNYVRMIANSGVGPRGRLISEKSFELFTTSHIELEEVAAAGYGYGLFTDQLDGRRLVRHTGGMVSFVSSMMVDLEHGVCAFSSINAMQGYRPTPVVQYALQLLGASREGKALPPLPAADSAANIANAADYAGIFKSGARSLEFVAEGDSLFLAHKGARVAIEKSESPDRFLILHRDFDRYLLVFGRKDAQGSQEPGGRGVMGAGLVHECRVRRPEGILASEGVARLTSATIATKARGSAASASCCAKGQLLVDGVIPLEPAGRLLLFAR